MPLMVHTQGKTAKFDEMFHLWEINKDQVHRVPCDNASDMVKAMSDALLPDLGCLAHTLQLVVNDGVLSQRAVVDMLAISQTILPSIRSPAGYSGRSWVSAALCLPG